MGTAVAQDALQGWGYGLAKTERAPLSAGIIPPLRVRRPLHDQLRVYLP